jgi:hypothetical protein
MSGHILEGTWEEITDHAAELSGKRVRLVVLDEAVLDEAPPSQERTLSEATLGIVGAINSSDGSEVEYIPTPFSEIIAQKFRDQGLKIP